MPPTLPEFSDYELLGVGGFSQVWKVTMRDSGQRVALKISLSRGDMRFEREAEAMARLGPAVCPRLLAQGDTEEGNRYLAMELLEGTTLAEWLASCKSQIPPLAEAKLVFRGLCQVVHRMHQAEILHRDLKPENTMLLTDGSIRLIDLGLARDLSDTHTLDEESLSLTQTGALLGTVAYIAPEQSLGRKNLGIAADIYALAVMGFELITGRPPFVGSRSSILQAHTWQKAPRASHLAHVTPVVDDVLARGLAKDPQARWPSALEFADALAESVATPPPPDPPPTAARSSRRPMALLAVQGPVSVAQVQKSASSLRGQIARTSRDSCVVVFASSSSLELGVDAAVAVGHELLAQATTCVIHVARLRARSGARGVIVMGDAIKGSALWSSSFGEGIFATEEAAPFISESQLVDASKGGHRVLRAQTQSMASTTAAVDWASLAIRVQPWGREDFIREVETRARRCFDRGQALLTTVIGDVGLGKTHFTRYLLERARTWKKVRVISVRAGAEREDRGDALLRSLVREAFALTAADQTVEDVKKACERLLGAEAAREAWPVVARTLELLDSSEFGRQTSLVGATAIRQALARAVANALIRVAGTQPLAVLVDDAHRADFTTLDALELATLGERSVPLWVLAVAGPQLEELRSNWGARAARAERHELTPLDEESARGMLLQLLFPVEFIPEPVIAKLVELTQGIPLYLEEVASALKQSGVVRQREGTESWIVAADELVAASKTPLGTRLARSALGSMREDLALFAQMCAVIGEGITVSRVDAVQRELDAELGFSDVDPDAGLRHLVERRFLRRPNQGRHAFRHPMMRDAVEALVPQALRRVLHAAVLRALDPESTAPARLARHAELCGESRLAARKYLEVASTAESRFRYVEAQQGYASALANLGADDSVERERALTGRGRVHHCVGRHDDALDDLRAAMEVATTRGDNKALAEMLLEQATIFDWKFQFAESAEAARKAAALVGELQDFRLQLRSDLATARSTFREHNVLEAIEQLARIEREANEIRDYATRVIALALLGGALAGVERLDEAETCLNRMASLSERVGDRFHLAVAYANRMLVWSARHDYARAIEDAQQAMAVAREVGAFPVVWVAQYTLAQLLMWLGRYDEAVALAEKAREIQHRFSEHPDPGDTLLVARIKVLRCAETGAAPDELAYLREQYAEDELSPSHQLQTRMVELWERDGSAEAWNHLLQGSDEVLDANERLELLLLYGRAAKREGRGADVVHAATLAHELADRRSIWLEHFDHLTSDVPV